MYNVTLPIFIFLSLVAILVWGYLDGKHRGKNPYLVVCLLVFFPLGLIIWLLFRPEMEEKTSEKPFDITDYREQ